MKNLILVLLVLGLLFLLISCGGSDDEGGGAAAPQTDAAAQTEAGQVAPSTGEMASGAAAVAASCTKCHGLDKVCAKIGKLDKVGWATVMAQMIQKGADIDRPTALGAAEFMGQQPDAAKAALCN